MARSGFYKKKILSEYFLLLMVKKRILGIFQKFDIKFLEDISHTSEWITSHITIWKTTVIYWSFLHSLMFLFMCSTSYVINLSNEIRKRKNDYKHGLCTKVDIILFKTLCFCCHLFTVVIFSLFRVHERIEKLINFILFSSDNKEHYIPSIQHFFGSEIIVFHFIKIYFSKCKI